MSVIWDNILIRIAKKYGNQRLQIKSIFQQMMPRQSLGIRSHKFGLLSKKTQLYVILKSVLYQCILGTSSKHVW